MAQESEQVRRPAAAAGGGGNGRATAPHMQGQEAKEEIEGEHELIDQDLIDAYLDVPHRETVHSILDFYDPRYNVLGIHKGIEYGGYRRALEKLLKEPPPRHPLGIRVADNRARMLERLGRYEEAEALYRDLVEEEPDQPMSHLDMARVLEHLGRREESAEALARACRLHPDSRRAFEMGMRPDPRQFDPAAVPLRLILPMSVITAAGTVRSRAELSAASLLVQSECGLDMYAPAGSRLPGCAGLGADAERFHHLVVEDVVSYGAPDEPAYYYDLTDKGIEMIDRLGERLGAGGKEGGAARIAASARRAAQIGAHAVLEEACRTAERARARLQGAGGDRAAELARLQGTAGRIIAEIGNGILFGSSHASTLETMSRYVPDMLSQAQGATDGQWAVASALGGDILGLCARVAFDQRPHPRTVSVGPPYPDIQDLYSLLVLYCGDRGIARPRAEAWAAKNLTAKEIEEIKRDMLKVISES